MQNRDKYYLKKFNWSEYWYVCWSENRKPERVSTRETDRGAAEEFKARLVLELGKEQRDESELLISDALDFYMEHHSPHTHSHATHEYYVKHLYNFFSGKKIEEISTILIRNYVIAREAKEIRTETIRRELSILNAALNFLRRDRKLNYQFYIPLPQKPPGKDRWLKKEEAVLLMEHCTTPHLLLFVALALYTGQRSGAILDLRWPQVDLEAGIIDFNPPGRVRTNKKRSVIKISQELNVILAAAKERHDSITTHDAVIYFRGDGVKDIKRGFNKAATDAGLKDVTPHTLRHTCGTWLAQAGVPLWEISGILGHSAQRTTELYCKHCPDYLANAVNKITLANDLQTNGLFRIKKLAKSAERG